MLSYANELTIDLMESLARQEMEPMPSLEDEAFEYVAKMVDDITARNLNREIVLDFLESHIVALRNYLFKERGYTEETLPPGIRDSVEKVKNYIVALGGNPEGKQETN